MYGQINYCLLLNNCVYSRYFSLSDGENGLYIFGLATLALLPTFFYRLAHVHFFIVFFSLPMKIFSIFSQSIQKILKKRRLASLALLSTLFLHHYIMMDFSFLSFFSFPMKISRIFSKSIKNGCSLDVRYRFITNKVIVALRFLFTEMYFFCTSISSKNCTSCTSFGHVQIVWHHDLVLDRNTNSSVKMKSIFKRWRKRADQSPKLGTDR